MTDRQDARHDPTAVRIRQARREGRFARSRELAVAITWLGGAALLLTLGPDLWSSMVQFGRQSWSGIELEQATNPTGEVATASIALFWSNLAPLLGGLALIAAISWLVQSGFRFYPERVSPDVQRLSPGRNRGQVIQLENVVSVLLGLLKLVGLILVAAWIILGDIRGLASMSLPASHAGHVAMSQWVASAVLRLCLASLVVGILDYFIRWQLNRRALRMTDQELRDEQRSTDPSAEVSARRRLLQG